MNRYFAELTEILNKISGQTDFQEFNRELIKYLRTGSKTQRYMYIAGNGGSFASAAHLATDLSYLFEKGVTNVAPLTLSSNVQLSRIANDCGYSEVFARDLESSIDLVGAVFVLSVSGSSSNIINVLERSKAFGIPTYSLLGFTGEGPAKGLSDYSISVPSKNFRIVEDAHMAIISSVLSKFDQR